MPETKPGWGPWTLKVGETLRRDLGTLCLRVRREPEELWVSTGPRETNEGALEWARWSASPDTTLELRPTLPARPVVVIPERPFHLPPRGAARVFVRIPLVAALDLLDEEGRRASLGEFPTLTLPDTWWGGFTEGILAYSLTTRARRTLDNAFEPHLAVCPLVLLNESREALPVEYFVMRVVYLTLFGRGDAVWTDEVQVRYEGLNEESEVRYTGRVPRIAGEIEQLAESRERPPRGLRAKTFGRILSLSLGG